jgi:hypothetical protein
MSSGSFVTALYEAEYDTSVLHPVRVQPETISAVTRSTAVDNFSAEASPGLKVSPISAFASGGRRGIGLFCRRIVLILPSGGSPPSGYSPSVPLVIPVLNGTFWADTPRGAEVEYLGVVYVVRSRQREVVR